MHREDGKRITSATADSRDRAGRRKADKFAGRQAALADAALQTLAELGYARTSLREIAQNSAFSHGVLHYYFQDKVDLILCGVRRYKARCVTRYERMTLQSHRFDELVEGFLEHLAGSLRSDARLHRLWYDLRAQAMFEEVFRPDVAAIDRSLQDTIWRVMVRLGELNGRPPVLAPATCYAMLDGLFQQHLLRQLSGDAAAPDALKAQVREVLMLVAGGPADARPAARSKLEERDARLQ